jgi:hypothetical protein
MGRGDAHRDTTVHPGARGPKVTGACWCLPRAALGITENGGLDDGFGHAVPDHERKKARRTPLPRYPLA